jgi:hypothetical protein
MRKDNVKVTITSCSIILIGMAVAACVAGGGGDTASGTANARAACSRETLQKLADTYVKAQTAGKAGTVPLAKGAYYGENDKAVDITKGVLAGPLKVDFTRSFYDTTQCAAFTEVVAATDPHPYVIHTRMEAGKDGKVSKMESIVTDAGDWVFGATEHLAVTRVEKWDEIPKEKRDTRAAIQAAADAYLDNWGNPDLPVPHGTPCSRLEGRMSITTNRNPAVNPCTMGAFPQKLNVTNRRYVIDEAMGAVAIFHNFPWLDAGIPTDPGTPASQTFRVEGGKNRYIHEVTVCTSPNCGRGGAPGGGGPGAGGPGRQGGAGPGAAPGGPGRQGGPGPGAAPGGPPRQGGPGPGPAPAPAAPGGA